MKAVFIVSLIARIDLVATMLLGLLFWITGISFIYVHILLGLLGTLGLLSMALVALFTRTMRLLGAVSIVYAFALPVFGETQITLLIGELHWLIQAAHLLVGIGAMVLIQLINRRYQRRGKSTIARSATGGTAAVQTGK